MGLERRGAQRRDIEHATRASYRRPQGLKGSNPPPPLFLPTTYETAPIVAGLRDERHWLSQLIPGTAENKLVASFAPPRHTDNRNGGIPWPLTNQLGL